MRGKSTTILAWTAVLSACPLSAQRPVPEDASEQGRFLLLETNALPTCGVLDAVIHPPGLIPAPPDPVVSTTWLVELASDTHADGERSDGAASVFLVDDTYYEPGSGLQPLPEPQKVWRLDGDRFAPRAIDDIEQLLGRLRVIDDDACIATAKARCGTPVSPCRTFDTYEVELQESSLGLGVVAPLADNSLLVSNLFRERDAPPSFSRVSRTLTSSLDEVPMEAAYAGGFVDGQGKVWLYGPEGRFSTWTEADGFEELPTSSTSAAIDRTWLAGHVDTDTVEIFAVTDARTFERYDGERWEELVAAAPPQMKRGLNVVWLAPAEAMAIGVRDFVVSHYRSGVLADIDLRNEGATDLLTAIAVVPSLGVVVGTRNGMLYAWDGARWDPIPRSPADGVEVNAILPFEDGFIFGREPAGLDVGHIVQWLPIDKVCDATRMNPISIRKMALLANGEIVTEGETNAYDSWITMSRAVLPFVRCDNVR